MTEPTQGPRPRFLPILVLADTSGSMSVDGKIEVLNASIDRMLASFRELDIAGCVVQVGVIAFGGEEANLHLSLTPVSEIQWGDLQAAGRTPMGSAFDLARSLLDDPNVVPARSFRPNLVLVSDGIPTDDWRGPLKELDAARQAQRALRFAIGIGADAKTDVLEQFAGKEGQVVPADQVEILTDFFDYVIHTVSVAASKTFQSQTELPTFVDYSTTDAVEF